MSEKYSIVGKKPLGGEVTVMGAKNMALKVLPAALLSTTITRFCQMPQIEDISRLLELLSDIGVSTHYENEELVVDATEISHSVLKEPLVRRIRAAVMLIAPLLHRNKQVFLPHPGGCALGKRPIDLFIDGFTAFGAEVEETSTGYWFRAEKLKGTNFFFPMISHTATESMIMAAVLAEGETVLENCACEPEIIALADYLNASGAKIKGAGTHTIRITGVASLDSKECVIIPDRIEAGSFAILAALTGSNLKINDCVPEHLKALWSLFDRIGVEYRLGENFIEMPSQDISKYQAINVRTHEYPGFVTDLQAPLTLLLTQVNGMSLVHETIFEGRLYYTDLLNQMGAKIILCDPHRVIIEGPSKLYGKKVVSPDLRAGITMVLAGLIAEGETIIDNVYQIERGYASIVERLQRIGANIKKIDI